MAKHKPKASTAPTFNYPAVSVIVPLYNAEKYIGECLDSILAQTFQDFEVIIVDDCSTDSSCAIVESYREKFGGRLTFAHMDKNSGSGALPRNKGMMISRGEYIAFLDNDDIFTKTALEELYTLAKKFDADVVYCEDNFMMNADGTDIRRENDDIAADFVNKPTFEPDNLEERVKKISQRKYLQAQWRKLVRRSLIFDHEIFFPNIRPADDDVWTYGLVFYAKKFLRVPNVTYIRRLTENSIMRLKKTPQQTIKFWCNPIFFGIKALDDLMSRHEFFQKNPHCRYAVLEKFVGKVWLFLEASFQLPPFAVYETIKQAFGTKLGDQDVLIAALCTALNTYQRINAVNQQKFQKLSAQSKARIAALEAEVKRLKSKE